MTQFSIFALVAASGLVVGCGSGGGSSTASSNGGLNLGNPSARAELNWEAPTTEADGVTPLSNLAGYKIYYRKDGATYNAPIDAGNMTTYTLNMQGFSAGTYYFAVTAYDSRGNESLFSAEASKAIP